MVSLRKILFLVAFIALSYVVWRYLGPTWAVIYWVTGLSIAAVLWLLSWAKARKNKRSEDALSQDILDQGEEAEPTLSRAEQNARQQEIREKFAGGVQRFRDQGKDLYVLPWYLVVGEPGAGKTELIRHSKIGFPPGLHSGLQGVGGTLNMNWWFSNRAIILDLAGRLVFEGAGTAGGVMWSEFLKMLEKHRRNCPINGMFLVIPADGLLRDTPQQREAKAALITEQLESVQRELDVRFPVYVIVTKCDLIGGFNRFFDSLPAAEREQIFGWSKADSIDTPFDTEQLDAHLKEVRDRLEARRYHLLLDPSPRSNQLGRRADDVDELYPFPSNFSAITGPLGEYLKTIFTSNEWMLKPNFLRGIYFTSAMQKVPPQPDSVSAQGRVALAGTPLFIHQLLTRKVFPEYGLVTRATNATRKYVQRRLIMLGAGLGAVVLLTLLTWLGGNTLKKSVLDELDMWSVPASLLSPDNTQSAWPPIVERVKDPDSFVYSGTKPIRTEEGRRLSLGNFYPYMQRLASQRLDVPLVFQAFRPFGTGINRERRLAQRLIFEQGVIRPVLDAARVRLRQSDGTFNRVGLDALNELIRLECMRLGYAVPEPTQTASQIDLDALMVYVLHDRQKNLKAYREQHRDYFDEVVRWNYSLTRGRAQWPAAWMERGDRLEDHPAIRAGVEHFLQSSLADRGSELIGQLERIQASWPKMVGIQESTERKYQEAEADYLVFFQKNLDAMSTFSGLRSLEKDWIDGYNRLQTVYKEIDSDYVKLDHEIMAIPLLNEADITNGFEVAVSNALAGIRASHEAIRLPVREVGLIDSLVDEVKKAKSKAKVEESEAKARKDGLPVVDASIDLGKEPDLIDDIQDRLVAEFSSIESRLLQADLLDQIVEFATRSAELKERVAGYRNRFEAYKPVYVSDALVEEPESWPLQLEDYRKTDVSFVHEDLEHLSNTLVDRFGKYGSFSLALPTNKIKQIQGMAEQGLDRVGERNFKRECDKLVENWSLFTGRGLADRKTLLRMSSESFSRKYLIQVKKQETDLVGQYWTDRVHRTLKVLGRDCVKSAQTMALVLHELARFPLDAPGPGKKPLTYPEFLKAATILRELAPPVVDPEIPSLAAGDPVPVARINDEIERLRSLDIDLNPQWRENALGLVNALVSPDGGPLRGALKLLSYKDQLNQPSVLPHALTQWTVLSVQSPEDKAKPLKFRSFNLKEILINKLEYPGKPFDIHFYKYFSDAAPHRTLSFGGAWGILELLASDGARPSKEDPKVWQVEMQLMDDDDRVYGIWLNVQLENELPKKEDWPVLL